jgi:luciferase family oxidoreductase group 1
MRLSIVDLAPVPVGGSASDALSNSVALAQLAERVGYHRYWVAEHHGIGAAIASTCPEVLIARIAAATDTIRVGSGTALLNYSTPFKVAETYRALHAMFGDRIDLGLGRASSPPIIDAALRPEPDESFIVEASELGGIGTASGRLDDLAAWLAHEDQVAETVAWLVGAFAPSDPRSRVQLVTGGAGGPEPWLLGSSPTSALLAGRLGLRYGFAAFFDPMAAAMALRAYRASFQPSAWPDAPTDPHAMLAINLCCADTDDEADRLRASVEHFYRCGGDIDRPPLVDASTAVSELGAVPEPTLPGTGPLPRHLSGSPERVRLLIDQLAEECQADEIMIQDLIADPGDRLRSYELIAAAFRTDRPAPSVAV